MKLVIETPVKQDYKTVWQGFTKELFLALTPPLTPIEVLRFDGCRKGDEIHLRIGLSPLTQRWKSKIIEQKETENEIYFIDEGLELPFFLSYWHHKHRIIKQNEGALIIDEINFESFHGAGSFSVYPILYLQFATRKSIYQEWFEKDE
jgi:ligand-binding SRPBCC domain-containing protein